MRPPSVNTLLLESNKTVFRPTARRFNRSTGPGWQVNAPEVHRLATLPDNQQTQISLLTHYRAPLSHERAALNHKALI